MKNIEMYKNALERLKGSKRTYSQELKESRSMGAKFKNEWVNLGKSQALIQEVAKNTQSKLKFHIQDIVQLALDTCYPDVYEFQVEFEIKRGKTEARLFFLKDGEEINPIDSAGGGVVDLAAFALRISAWSLGKTDNVMILDEPFKHLSRDLQPKAGMILKQLSEKLNLQIIMVTHNDDMESYSDRIFKVGIRKGVSKVEKISI